MYPKIEQIFERIAQKECNAMKKYVFVTAQSGTFTNEDGSERKWANVKLADPETFENHTIPYDQDYLREDSFPSRGTKVEPVFDMRTPFKKTSVVMIGFHADDKVKQG